MNEVFIAALAALNGVVGINSFDQYETNIQNQNSQMVSFFGDDVFRRDGSTKEGYRSFDIFSPDGSMEYMLVEHEEDALIYDKYDQSIVETFVGNNPYSGYEANFNVYVDCSEKNLKYLTYEDGRFFSLVSSLDMNNGEFAKIATTIGYKSDTYTGLVDDSIPEDATKIPNYEYFMNLGSHHAYNPAKICGIVATEILLGYYDTFLSDLIVEEKYEMSLKRFAKEVAPQLTERELFLSHGNYIGFFNDEDGIGDCTQSMGYDFHIENQNSNNFAKTLIKMTKQYQNFNPETSGMTNKQVNKLVDKYMNLKHLNHSMKLCEGNISDYNNFYAKTIIKNAINKGRPVIAGGTNHFVVAFAYDDAYVYAHTGWGSVKKTKWSTFKGSNIFSACGAIDLIFKDDHVHSEHYYSVNQEKYYCPCGSFLNEEDLQICNLNYGTNFTNDEIIANLIDMPKQGIDVVAERKAAAATPEGFKLKPYSSKIGESHLYLSLNKNIRKISFKAHCFETNEGEIISNLSQPMFVIKNSNEWSELAELDLSKCISGNANFVGEYEFDFVEKEPISEFGFVFNYPILGSGHEAFFVIEELKISYYEP